jgi:hypothetical protein
MLLEARGYGSEMLNLVEEALDQVAIAVKEWAERWDVDPVRHRLDVGPGTLLVETGAERQICGSLRIYRLLSIA